MTTGNIDSAAGIGCPAPTCSAFEFWWAMDGVKIEPPVLQEAMKEVAWKGWLEASKKSVSIAESWGTDTPSALRLNLLPNAPSNSREE